MPRQQRDGFRFALIQETVRSARNLVGGNALPTDRSEPLDASAREIVCETRGEVV